MICLEGPIRCLQAIFVSAEELGPLFVHPGGVQRLWLVAVLIALPAAMIVVAGLVRGRLEPSTALAGIVLLPSFAYLLGNIVIMEESKSVEFCDSCHSVMGGVVRSISEPNGSLAATHFMRGYVHPSSEACYSCHSGYGIWGTLEAKRAGVMHMLNAVIGTYEFPLELNGVFDIDACLHCHAESPPFRAVDAHRDPEIQAVLVSREMSCTGLCHPAAHPPDALGGATQ